VAGFRQLRYAIRIRRLRSDRRIGTDPIPPTQLKTGTSPAFA
jgi:hypothetical protein